MVFLSLQLSNNFKKIVRGKIAVTQKIKIPFVSQMGNEIILRIILPSAITSLWFFISRKYLDFDSMSITNIIIDILLCMYVNLYKVEIKRLLRSFLSGVISTSWILTSDIVSLPFIALLGGYDKVTHDLLCLSIISFIKYIVYGGLLLLYLYKKNIYLHIQNGDHDLEKF